MQAKENKKLDTRRRPGWAWGWGGHFVFFQMALVSICTSTVIPGDNSQLSKGWKRKRREKENGPVVVSDA